jgi:farnesol dehydrogenase
MRVFVTGGTGFFGGRLIAKLHGAGFDIVALARRPGSVAGLPDGITLAPGDVTDLASLERGMEGCEAVFHAAALVKRWARDPLEFDKVNIEGLGNVLRACSRTRVRKILYTSSFIALGPTDGTTADEDHDPRPRYFHNDYERTKWAADRFARVRAREGEPIVILYPGVIYGEGKLTDGNIVAQAAAKLLDRTLPGTIGPGDRRQSFTWVDDAAEGHLLAFQKAEFGSRYILGGDNRTVRELLELVSKASGVPAPRRRIPYSVAGFVGRMKRLRAYLSGREPELTDQEVRIYRREWAYSSEKAIRELGYTITPLEDGVRRMVAWLQRLGHGVGRNRGR